MSSYDEFLKRYWSLREPEVQEMPTRRCKACAQISYVNFRADSVTDEWFRPRTLVIGDFLYVVKSAFAGCYVCRIVMVHIVQSFTHISQTMTCYESIKKIGLRLSLDDELSLHCWDGEGRQVRLSDLSVAGVIDLWDEQSNESEDGVRQADDEENVRGGLRWERNEVTGLIRLLECDQNKLSLNPSIEIQPLLLHHWLEDCLRNHPKCHSKVGEEAPTELPTRILDVGDTMSSRRTRLLVTNGLRAPYFTLSHCWGRTNHKMALSHATFDSFVAGVDDTEMPKTFHEAIMLTRNLGQRYLWIDSMCIMQPTRTDKDDWSREGARMGEYYSRSLLNFAASAGLDNTEGLFHARAGSQFDVKPFPLFEKAVHREWDEFSKIMNRDPNWLPIMQPKPASWLQHVQESPLSSRAWVLQERLLAPRTLHCTLQGFFWECSELRASEYEPLGCRPDYSNRDQGLLSLNQLREKEKNFILGPYWRHVVETFSQLRISFPSDRLPALVGLARTIQEHTKDTYVAGHFKTLLISSLLWFRLDPGAAEVQVRNSGAPSWSWASTSAQVKFTSLETKDYPSRDPKEYDWKAEVLHIESESSDMNPFGWLSHCSLKLRGYLKERMPETQFPELLMKNRSVQEQWSGHLPMPEEDSIGQIGAVHVHRGEVLEDLGKSETDEEPSISMTSVDDSLPKLEEQFEDISVDERSKHEASESDPVQLFEKAPTTETPIISGPRESQVSNASHPRPAHPAVCDSCEKRETSDIHSKCLDRPNLDSRSACKVSNAHHNHPDHPSSQPLDPRTQTASIAANHTLLHAKIEEEMTAMTNSPAWADLQHAPDPQREAHREPITIILDYPNRDEERAEEEAQFSLFLIMSSRTKGFHEGLVLIRADNNDNKASARFRRVGFFSTKSETVFDDAGLVEVELI